MTRKRFVKLLMAQGYGRNLANEFAKAANARGKSYKDEYDASFHSFEQLRASFPRIDTEAMYSALVKVADVAARVANALSAGFAAFSEAYRSAMDSE